MTWPAEREQMTAHVAGEAVQGEQRCARCNVVLYTPKFGAYSLWYPGQMVGVTDSGTVRMGLRQGHGHRECKPVDSESDA